ncbi:MAG: M23 family metallopeptidase [Gammaproteobacteria bacterium]|nr:M23 family metallopeptidase [Gammaproteobacteria bacterium]
MRLKKFLIGLLPLFLCCLGGAPQAANLLLEGSLVQGGMLVGKTSPGASVMVDGEPVRVSGQGLFLVGFGRDHSGKSEIQVKLFDGSKIRRSVQVARRDYKIQRIEGLPKRKVSPKKEDLVRIRRESAQARHARERNDPRTDFSSGWIWPVEGPISGVYGSQRILNGQPRRPHFGVDIAMPVGTPVVAPADGVVTLAHSGMFFSGQTLILDHGHRLSSSFLHLSKIRVKEGQQVKRGEVIAEVGKSGRVTGAHLDWRMNLGKHRIDPQLLVPPMPKQAAK